MTAVVSKNRRNAYGLTPQQDAFARAVAAGASQSDAYREAYPKSLNWKVSVLWAEASTMAAHPKVVKRIEDLRAQIVDGAILKAEMVLLETYRLCKATPAKLMRREKGPDGKDRAVMLMPDELDEDTAAAIKSFEIDDLGRIKYSLLDKNASLDRAAKILGMFERDNAQKNPAQAMWEMLVQHGKPKAEGAHAPGAGMIFKPLPSAAMPDGDVIDMDDA